MVVTSPVRNMESATPIPAPAACAILVPTAPSGTLCGVKPLTGARVDATWVTTCWGVIPPSCVAACVTALTAPLPIRAVAWPNISTINQALRSRDGSLILDQFTSSSNASYLYIKEYVENGAVAENVVGYEYENSNVYDVSTGGDTISFQIEFRARTVYADGRRSELVKNVRSCVLKKVDGKYRFEVYE